MQYRFIAEDVWNDLKFNFLRVIERTNSITAFIIPYGNSEVIWPPAKQSMYLSLRVDLAWDMMAMASGATTASI